MLTGSIAIALSVFKVGTQRTIFSFFMAIAVYLLALFAIGLTNVGQLPPGVAQAAPAGSGPLEEHVDVPRFVGHLRREEHRRLCVRWVNARNKLRR